MSFEKSTLISVRLTQRVIPADDLIHKIWDTVRLESVRVRMVRERITSDGLDPTGIQGL